MVILELLIIPVERGTTYVDPGATTDTGELVTINTSGLNMAVSGNYTVTYSATDADDNIGTAIRNVIVEDNFAPVITLVNGDPGTPDYTVERGTTYVDPGATTDTGELVTINTSGLNMAVSGNYTVTYSATDADDNIGTAIRNVIVEDNFAPVITLVNGDEGTPDYTVERGTTYVDPGATTDTGELVTINTSGLNMAVSGNYTVTYSATDADDNTGTASRTVIVEDNFAPVITLVNGDPGTTDYTVERGTTYVDPGATADGGETVTVNTSGLNMDVSGNYTVTYSATDADDNTGTASRTVIVEDNFAPVITLVNGDEGTTDYTVERGTTYVDPGATTDTGELVTINISDLNMAVSGNYTVTYSATDADDNTGTASRTVIVEDNFAPVITLSGDNPYIVDIGTTYVDPGATADGGETVTVNTSGLNMDVHGTYTVTYSATDADGNTGTVSRTVMVNGFTQSVKLTASDAAGGDFFGYSVGISGNYAIVGARKDGATNTFDGSAYIFHRTAGTNTWDVGTKTAKSNITGGFGVSVDISGDYAIVGSTGGSGSYIFHRTGTNTWDAGTNITTSDAEVYDYFGISVAISGDYAIVGAWGKDNSAGAAYIFHRTGTTTWGTGTKIVASDRAGGDNFGYNVGISGNYAIVGAYKNDDNGPDSGSAYIFRRTGTNTWDDGTKIVASDAAGYDNFGWSVAISGDYAIVGARNNDSYGSAYIFRRTGTNAWDSGTKIVASDAASGDQFGTSVAISGDYAIVGAWAVSNDGIGAAYIFSRTDTNTWDNGKKIIASDPSGDDYFGFGVDISGDYAIAGAYGNDDDGSFSGSAYIFS
jgi:formate-dependent nitrite reductase cytochrome c552 subunit